MDALYERTSHIDWMRIRRVSHLTGLVVVAFAAGGWWHSIKYQEAQRPYEVRATHQLEQLKEITGPNPIAAINCQRRAIALTKTIAAQAITVARAQDPDAALPSLAAVPSCPTVPKPAVISPRKAP